MLSKARCSAVQCSAVQFSAPYSSTVQCSAERVVSGHLIAWAINSWSTAFGFILFHAGRPDLKYTNAYSLFLFNFHVEHIKASFIL
jgi:hypothetical protein